MKPLPRLMICLLVPTLLWVNGASAELKRVEATGEGISPERAKKNAMRNALEKGAGLLLANYSKVENFQLIRDTTFTRSEGLVQSYDIIEQGEAAGGLFYCTIRATVSTDAVARAWGEVQNVLDQRGNPKIMVHIVETIDGVQSPGSILESKIEERLINIGFQVCAKDQLSAIERREADDATRHGQVAKMQALAKRFKTQIFITGYANADKADRSSPHGVSLVNYNCDVQTKVYYTDTATMLDSTAIPVTRGGARGRTEFSPQAGKMAIYNAAQGKHGLIDIMYETVMKNWAAEISFGGRIDLEVSGLPKAVHILRLKKSLKRIPGVESINTDKSEDGMVYFRIRAKMTGEDLAEHLADDKWERKLELLDWSLNRVQAKWVGD
ncbi:MAG: hypothetical protein V3W34_08875 [Phycisphaerae bacterium]